MTWSSSLWWPCVMDLDMNPVIKSWFGQEEGGSSFLSGKQAGGSQRAEKDNSTNQGLSASPYHKPFADKQPHATSYQTCSFTFFPSTSMVFTLKSIPGRQQGWGVGGAKTALNTPIGDKNSHIAVDMSHPHSGGDTEHTPTYPPGCYHPQADIKIRHTDLQTATDCCVFVFFCWMDKLTDT